MMAARTAPWKVFRSLWVEVMLSGEGVKPVVKVSELAAVNGETVLLPVGAPNSCAQEELDGSVGSLGF